MPILHNYCEINPFDPLTKTIGIIDNKDTKSISNRNHDRRSYPHLLKKETNINNKNF